MKNNYGIMSQPQLTSDGNLSHGLGILNNPESPLSADAIPRVAERVVNIPRNIVRTTEMGSL